MNRAALICAALFVTVSAFLSIFGIAAVTVLGFILCFSAAISAFVCKRRGSKYGISAVLLVGAAFCLYLNIFTFSNVNRIEALDGKEQTVICRAVEEPQNYSSGVRVLVESDGSNGFDEGSFNKVRFYLFIPSEHSAAKVEEGDILNANVLFSKVDDDYKNRNFAERVFISAKCSEPEIIGHSESLYTRCIDIRKAIRVCIREYTNGDNAGLLEGILLGGTDNLSFETYTAFKACGVTHITAVSGMHISAFCMMLAYLLRYIMSRRMACAIALIPLILEVMLAGFTPSALRSGIMCSIFLLANCLVKRSDSLNSLGIAVVSMLIFNPYYICNVGFQLSCAAAAGVIIVSPYAVTLADKLVKFDFKYLTKFLKGSILTVIQTIGATLFTLPFQIITFGFVSMVFLPANLLICTASVIAMGLTVSGAVLHFVPFLKILAQVPFVLAEWLAEYMIAVVRLLAKVPFSYIPFGSNSAVLWCGVSLFLVAIWMLFNRCVGLRFISLSVVGLLLVSMWSDYIFSRNLANVTVFNSENGFCSVVTYEEACVIIGCGNNSNYDLVDYMRDDGIANAEMLLLLSDNRDCFNGYDFVKDNFEPEMTVVPENFGNSAVIFGETKIIANGDVFTTKDKNITVIAHIFEGGCAYEINVAGRCVLVGFGRYYAEDIGFSEADILVSDHRLPLDLKSEITLVSSKDNGFLKPKLQRKIYCSGDGNISVKFRKGKGMSVYAG